MKRISLSIFLSLILVLPSASSFAEQTVDQVFEQVKSLLLKGEFERAADVFVAYIKQLVPESDAQQPPQAQPQNPAKPKLPKSELKLFSALFEQGEKALVLTSCIAHDLMDLIEQHFGQSGRELTDTFKQTEQVINKFSTPDFLNGNKAAYQFAKRQGRQSKAKNCSAAAKEYVEFKKQLATRAKGMGYEPSEQFFNHHQKVYYHSALDKRYKELVRQANR